jgi:hypothetical protein
VSFRIQLRPLEIGEVLLRHVNLQLVQRISPVCILLCMRMNLRIRAEHTWIIISAVLQLRERSYSDLLMRQFFDEFDKQPERAHIKICEEYTIIRTSGFLAKRVKNFLGSSLKFAM